MLNMSLIGNSFFMLSRQGGRSVCAGIGVIVSACLLQSFSLDAQSMAHARTKMLRDPGNPIGIQLRLPPSAVPEYDLPGLHKGITFADGVDEDEQEEIFLEIEPEPVEEEIIPWRGYLREKGPARLVVENEEGRELQPLSEEIWALISGANKKKRTEMIPTDLLAKTDETEEQVQGNNPMNAKLASNMEPIEEITQDESLLSEYDPDSYQKLMELFSRPVVRIPISHDEKDGYVAFRLPENPTSASVREGSQAKYEIRKN